MKPFFLVLVLASQLAWAAPVPLPLPSGPGAMGARLAPARGGEATLVLSWLEGQALKFSSWNGTSWSAPILIAQNKLIQPSSSDFPSLFVSTSGTYFADWFQKTKEGAPGYGVQLASSSDQGKTWKALGPLNSDHAPAEHGFASWAEHRGKVYIFWLDGREMKGEDGNMNLRATIVDSTAHNERLLDGRVCSCCGTAAVSTTMGPVVFFRDRTEDEIRDISVIRWVEDVEHRTWSKPTPVSNDGWKIKACPVNGPAAAAQGNQMAVAWYTGAKGTFRTLLAFSSDFGKTFSAPVQISAHSLGRVGVALDDNGDALVSTVEGGTGKTKGRLLVTRVSLSGKAGEPRIVTDLDSPRMGFPQMERVGGNLFFVWTEANSSGGKHLAGVKLPLSEIPGP